MMDLSLYVSFFFVLISFMSPLDDLATKIKFTYDYEQEIRKEIKIWDSHNGYTINQYKNQLKELLPYVENCKNIWMYEYALKEGKLSLSEWTMHEVDGVKWAMPGTRNVSPWYPGFWDTYIDFRRIRTRYDKRN